MDSLSSFAEDQSEAAEAPLKKEMTKYGKSSAENLMKIKSIIENIMMIVRGIVAIITGFFRICIPPAILAIFSCPEAAFFLDNLATLLQFSEKTEDYMQKIEAYPTFYNNMGVKKSKFGYYLCAQAVFTSECSALWPRCQELSFLFTQPPFTVVILI